MTRRSATITPQQALVRLEELCARSEQCSADLRIRLIRWHIAPAAIDSIIADLTERRFIDDARFARSYVRDKYRFSGWGRIKIRMALIAKRIPADIITAALASIDTAEYARIAFGAILARRRQRALTNDYRGRATLMQYGLQRGYEPALMTKILDSNRLWRDD